MACSSRLWVVICTVSHTLGLSIERESLPATRFNTSIHVLLSRALFDHRDHVDRVGAIRKTWARDPQVRLHVLDFGAAHFEEQFQNWCTNLEECEVHYEVAPKETSVPEEVMSSSLWNLDGHIWAMEKALEDPSCHWILIGQDMLYLHMGHLREYLSTLDSQKPLVLGSKLHSSVSGEMVSPWGFFLSRSAAQSLVNGWNTGLRAEVMKSEFCRKIGGLADYAFGLALKQIQPPVEFVDTRTENGEDRLYLWPPSRMERGDWWDSWYPDMRIDKPKQALSSEAFLFFFAGPREIQSLGSFFEEQRPVRGMYKDSTWQMLARLRNNGPASSGPI